MSNAVDMSLDDIIKKNKGAGRGRGRGRGRRGRPTGGRPAGGSFSGRGASGAARRGPLGINARSSQYAIAKPSRAARRLPWQNDLLEDSIRAAGITGVEVGTKLYLSNLDFGVTNEDIRELFSEIGDIKRYAVHFDKNGRPSGSAEVVYTRRSDAIAALKKYNNVLLDGKPMKIEILGASDVPVSAQVNVTGVNGLKRRTVFMMSGPGPMRGPATTNRGAGQSQRGGGRGGRGRSRGGGRGGGRGRGRGRGKKQEKSADQLDKELEKYHSDAMQT